MPKFLITLNGELLNLWKAYIFWTTLVYQARRLRTGEENYMAGTHYNVR